MLALAGICSGTKRTVLAPANGVSASPYCPYIFQNKFIANFGGWLISNSFFIYDVNICRKFLETTKINNLDKHKLYLWFCHKIIYVKPILLLNLTKHILILLCYSHASTHATQSDDKTDRNDVLMILDAEFIFQRIQICIHNPITTYWKICFENHQICSLSLLIMLKINLFYPKHRKIACIIENMVVTRLI